MTIISEKDLATAYVEELIGELRIAREFLELVEGSGEMFTEEEIEGSVESLLIHIRHHHKLAEIMDEIGVNTIKYRAMIDIKLTREDNV